MIRHIVLFKFRKNITRAEIEDAFQLLGNLRLVIPEIQSFSWGKYESIEGRSLQMNQAVICFL